MMNKFFWGSNTARGFVSYALEFYPRAQRRVLIKSGPGTGKSTFLTKVAEATPEPVFFYCSSAPSSLDAIADFSKGYFIADATYPHVLEPEVVGARDEILDLGMFLDKNKLKTDYEKIVKLKNLSRQHFSLAYATLNKALKVRDVLEEIEEPSREIDKGFVEIYAELRALDLPRRAVLGESEKRFVSAYTPLGYRQLKVDNNALSIYLLRLRPTARTRYFHVLSQFFLGLGYDVWFFIDPLDGISFEGLYIPDKEIYIKAEWSLPENDLLQIYENEKTAAIEELKKASLVHEELEKIYIDAMDFDSLNSYLAQVLIDVIKAE